MIIRAAIIVLVGLALGGNVVWSLQHTDTPRTVEPWLFYQYRGYSLDHCSSLNNGWSACWTEFLTW